jgi:hypothetical protein
MLAVSTRLAKVGERERYARRATAGAHIVFGDVPAEDEVEQKKFSPDYASGQPRRVGMEIAKSHGRSRQKRLLGINGC